MENRTKKTICIGIGMFFALLAISSWWTNTNGLIANIGVLISAIGYLYLNNIKEDEKDARNAIKPENS